MWKGEKIHVEKSQAVKDAEARITAEEQAMTKEEREARFQRITATQETKSPYGWKR